MCLAAALRESRACFVRNLESFRWFGTWTISYALVGLVGIITAFNFPCAVAGTCIHVAISACWQPQSQKAHYAKITYINYTGRRVSWNASVISCYKCANNCTMCLFQAGTLPFLSSAETPRYGRFCVLSLSLRWLLSHFFGFQGAPSTSLVTVRIYRRSLSTYAISLLE